MLRRLLTVPLLALAAGLGAGDRPALGSSYAGGASTRCCPVTEACSGHVEYQIARRTVLRPVQETVYEDTGQPLWNRLTQVEFTFQGDSATHRVPITLEAGLTHDKQFLEWANQMNNPQGDGAMSLREYRKEVTVEVLNMQGVKVMAFTLSRAWPSEFQALPEMDANANAVAIQMLKLEYEGFALDESVVEPTET